MSRAEARRVEEARKSGELPPEMDNDGNLINPHVPQYMARAPWYLNQEEGAGLKHLKAQQGLQFSGNKEDFHAHKKRHGVAGESWAKFGLVANSRRGGAAASGIGDDGLSRPSRKRRRGNGAESRAARGGADARPGSSGSSPCRLASDLS